MTEGRRVTGAAPPAVATVRRQSADW